MRVEKEDKIVETKPSEEAPKPKIIRNRPVDLAASELAQDHILPVPPGKILDWEQTDSYFKLLTPAMWSHVMIYVYRIKPKIRRQLRDPTSPNYIDCVGGPITLEYFINRHGGGVYELQVNDSEKPGTGQTGNNSHQLFKCRFTIDDILHPPILEYAELELEAKENRSYIDWLQRTGVLDAKGKVAQPNPAAAPSAGNLSAKDVLGILEYAHKMSADQQTAFRTQFNTGDDSLSKSVGQILVERMKQDDPGRDYDRMMAWMKAQMEVMEKIVDRGNKPDTAMTAVLQILQSQIANGQEQRKTDLEYMRLMMEKLLTDQNRAANPRSQLSELKDLVGFVKELIPGAGGGGGRRNGWDTALDIARDVVLPLGSSIANIMALRNGGAQGAAGVPAKPPVPAAFDPYANPNAARAYASSMPQPQQPPTPPPPQPQPGPAPATDQEAQLFALFGQYGGLIVNHLNSSTPGYDFADYVAGLLGAATHAQIVAPGEQVLVAAMMKIPEIGMFGESRIRTFVNEFVHYQEYIQAAGEEETEEMPPFSRPQRNTASAATVEGK